MIGKCMVCEEFTCPIGDPIGNSFMEEHLREKHNIHIKRKHSWRNEPKYERWSADKELYDGNGYY